jgi:hypothetical protein
LCDSRRLRSSKLEKICEVILMRAIPSPASDSDCSATDAHVSGGAPLHRTSASTSHARVDKTTRDVLHATGLTAAGSTGSAGASGATERRDCFASCRAFLAASFCFFA